MGVGRERRKCGKWSGLASVHRGPRQWDRNPGLEGFQ